MKNALIFLAVLFILPCVGFFLQWLRWEVIPTIKDKIKAKKLQKKYRKTLDKIRKMWYNILVNRKGCNPLRLDDWWWQIVCVVRLCKYADTQHSWALVGITFTLWACRNSPLLSWVKWKKKTVGVVAPAPTNKFDSLNLFFYLFFEMFVKQPFYKKKPAATAGFFRFTPTVAAWLRKMWEINI